MSQIIEKITGYMNEDLGIDTSDIALDSPLFSTGIIDSFSLVSLLTYIEDTHNFSVNPADVNLDNFDSLEKMLAYITKKLDE